MQCFFCIANPSLSTVPGLMRLTRRLLFAGYGNPGLAFPLGLAVHRSVSVPVADSLARYLAQAHKKALAFAHWICETGPAFPLGYSQVPASRLNPVKHRALELERNTRPLPLPRLTIARCPAFWRDTVLTVVGINVDRDGKARPGIDFSPIKRSGKASRWRRLALGTSRNRCFNPGIMGLPARLRSRDLE